ncbi:MAG: ABC transporter ATP-binding protein [Candidatus Thorarchaeota archaeon]
MSTNQQYAIKATNLERTFRLGETDVHALRGIDLDIRPGEFVVVLGPSGSGKTTLLNQIGGIDKPDNGTLVVNNETLTSYSLNKLSEFRRTHVGWIFQFFNLIPSLSAWENVGLALELSNDKDDIRKKSVEMLKKVGLEEKVDRFPSQLSGGEQQRVAIARALVKNPGIVVADEPTGNLDWSTGQKIADLMKEMNKSLKSTFIVVSHDISITGHADRVFHLRDGKIIKVDDHVDKSIYENNSMPARKKVDDE